MIFPLLAAACFSMPVLAHASSNPYVSVSGGPGLMTNSTVNNASGWATYKTGYLINAAVGLKTDYARIEAEVGYHNNNLDTWGPAPAISGSSISMWTFMANGYIDYTIKDLEIAPYLMAGLGLAAVQGNDTSTTKNDSVLAWQLGAGISFKASEKVSIDLGYRYFAAGDAKLDADTFSISSHNIIAGIRYEL
ncbi:MAG: porin family protein [Chlorobium sp.]|nr:MAG: porin family protein [Chlorobium sp.]